MKELKKEQVEIRGRVENKEKVFKTLQGLAFIVYYFQIPIKEFHFCKVVLYGNTSYGLSITLKKDGEVEETIVLGRDEDSEWVFMHTSLKNINIQSLRILTDCVSYLNSNTIQGNI